jgi:hypothetical protein
MHIFLYVWFTSASVRVKLRVLGVTQKYFWVCVYAAVHQAAEGRAMTPRAQQMRPERTQPTRHPPPLQTSFQ